MQKLFKNKKMGPASHRQAKAGRGGFTLVETLVAIAIFSISILGVLSVMASSISDTTYAKNKLVAGYLAQEGVEYVKNLRDTDVLYSTDGSGNSTYSVGWTTFTSSLIPKCSTYGCYFGDLSGPVTTLVFTPCSPSSSDCSTGANNGTIYYNTTTGKYGSTGTSTGFVRQIIVTPVTGTTDEVNVKSTVSWKQGSGTYNISVTDNLYNWVNYFYE